MEKEIPTFYFYKDDVRSNGNISEQAIARECHSVYPSINSRLVSELKYMNHANEPISIRIGDRDMFRVQFVNDDDNKTK